MMRVYLIARREGFPVNGIVPLQYPNIALRSGSTVPPKFARGQWVHCSAGLHSDYPFVVYIRQSDAIETARYLARAVKKDIVILKGEARPVRGLPRELFVVMFPHLIETEAFRKKPRLPYMTASEVTRAGLIDEYVFFAPAFSPSAAYLVNEESGTVKLTRIDF